MRIKIYITEMEITKLQFSLCELLKFKTIMDNTIGQKDKNILKRKFGFINIDNGKVLSNKETKTQLWIEINHTHFEIRIARSNLICFCQYKLNIKLFFGKFQSLYR